MNTLDNFLGKLCKIVLPINEEVYFGNKNSSIAICTLSSIKLLKEIANSQIMTKIFLVGRLFSENKGIDSIIHSINSENSINTIILCGKDVIGHKAGHSLIQLHQNGLNESGRIIGSTSPEPILRIPSDQIFKFQKKIKIINKIGITNLNEIKQVVDFLEN